MIKYSFLITYLLLATFSAPLFARDKVADMINTFRKNRGVANEIVADSFMSEACRTVLQKEDVKKLGKAERILAIREFLKREHIFDAQCELLEVTGVTLDDAFSEDSIVQKKELRSVFSDEEFNRIGYVETREGGKIKVQCFVSKRFVEFPMNFGFEYHANFSGPPNMYLTFSGKSHIDTIYYSEGFYNTMSPDTASNLKPVPLLADKSFLFTIQTYVEKPGKFRGVAMFDKRKKLIAFIRH